MQANALDIVCNVPLQLHHFQFNMRWIQELSMYLNIILWPSDGFSLFEFTDCIGTTGICTIISFKQRTNQIARNL